MHLIRDAAARDYGVLVVGGIARRQGQDTGGATQRRQGVGDLLRGRRVEFVRTRSFVERQTKHHFKTFPHGASMSQQMDVGEGLLLLGGLLAGLPDGFQAGPG